MASSSGSSRRPNSQEWLKRYASLQGRYDARLNRLLRDASADIDLELKALSRKNGIGAQIRAAQLREIKAVIHKVLAGFWAETGDVVRAAREEAVVTALEMGFDWDEILLARAVPDHDDRVQMRKYLAAAATRNVDAMLRRAFGTYTPLSTRVYRTRALANGWVDRAVNSGVAQGMSAEGIAKKVKGMINPQTPGGVTYAARRLARSEINNAFHGQTIVDNAEKPWNTGMRWHLSDSHSVPDECNAFSVQENGMGPGVFPVGQVPSKPHPQCFCYVTPNTLSVAQFDAAFRRGVFDSYLQEKYDSSAA